MLTSTLSYVAFIFSGPLVGTLPHAIGFGLVSAGMMAILFALFSRVPFAIAGPDSKPTAVLAVMAALVAAGFGAETPPAAMGLTVLAVLAAGTVATGAAMFAFGALRMGEWFRFVPYPVASGFMAASGWLLSVGGIGVLTGLRVSPGSLPELATGHRLGEIAAGCAFAAALGLVRRVRHPLALPALLIAAVAAVHAALAASGYSIAEAREAGWLLDVGGGAALANPLTLARSLTALPLGAAGLAGGEFIGLVAVTATTLLLSLVVIEVQSRRDVDLDRELRLNGIANLLVGLAGGMVGTISVTRTLFNYETGARSRASGIIAGAICLAVLAAGTGPLGYFPVPILGGLLIFQGAGMLNEWLVRGWRTMALSDLVQVLIIMGAIVHWNFVAGVAIGVVAACVTFAINTSRIRLVKLGLDRSSYRSRVDRPTAHQEALLRHGGSIQIMWLHGFVFFGSAHRLLLDVKRIVATRGERGCRSLILDFREVLGIDSSAMLTLHKLWHFAAREGFAIAVSSPSPPVEAALRAAGLIRQKDAIGKLFPDMDAALEWCEDELIAEGIGTEDALRSADEWLTREIGSRALFARLLSYLELIEFRSGQSIFEQGSKPDALYLLYAGRVTILYRTADGKELRLRSMVGQTVVGEMGLYRTEPRVASVRADRLCIVYRLSTEAMAQMEADDPSLAYAFHKFIVRILATRLEFANREIAAMHG